MLLGDIRFRLAGEDILGTLPKGAARRVQNYSLRSDEALAIQRALGVQVDEQRARKQDWEQQLRLQQSRFSDGRSPAHGGPATYQEDEATAALDAAARANAALTWVGPRDPASVIELKTKISRAFHEIRRLETAREPKSALWQQRGQLVRNIEGYLRGGIPFGCALRPLPEPSPKLGNKEDLLAAIENRRRRCREIVADISATEAAPITAAAAKQKITEYFMKLAARGPSIERLVFGGDLELPMLQMRATPVLQPAEALLIGWQQLDAEALLAFAFGEALQKKLGAEVDTALAELKATGTVPLTDAQRATRLADLQRDHLSVEREEIALIELAHAQGMTTIEFRTDASPLALLNCELITTPDGIAQ